MSKPGNLLNLPKEVFSLIIDQYIYRSGIYKALRVRTVNKSFLNEIDNAIFERELVGLEEYRDKGK
ncbi:hypothetical protein M501DRAFT_1020555 [Patellaria atrata CBS 101060]|uniref:Uncharacterized protein n=1 Tax=Patellaria atrata CBS 101060 TaxID=1346257 RepID=A0A9P4S1Q7_9PEZI|nr:hypothetical protein M501DRAFT_1020555 [Patellaria atrata CBS 101060]